MLVVEDILDSGVTLSFLLKNLSARQPRSIRLCTLLDKPERRKVDIRPDYVGAVVPDEFIVGYGLDYAEKYRNHAVYRRAEAGDLPIRANGAVPGRDARPGKE